MPATDGPSAGQMTEESLTRSEACVALMEVTLQRISQEMVRARLLVDRLARHRQPPTE